MTTYLPVAMEWTGDSAVPATPYFQKIADKQFVVGEIYNLVVMEPR